MPPRNQYAPLLLVASGLVLLQGGAKEPPATPLAGELGAIFHAAPDGRTHARTLAEICHAAAEQIEFDGTLGKPRLINGNQFDELRAAIREGRTKGWSFVTAYPGLRPILETHFAAAVGVSGGPVDKTRRAAWVVAFRQLGAAAEHTAGRRWWTCACNQQQAAAAGAVAYAALTP